MAIPKAQPYPSSKIKVGAVLFSITESTDANGKTSTEVVEWVVRSIRAKRGEKSRFGVRNFYAEYASKYVNLTAKIDFVTWGKCSKKIGDYGWLSSIPPDLRKQFKVGDDLPGGIYTTVRAAILYKISSEEKRVAWYESEIEVESDATELEILKSELTETNSHLAALKRRLARLSSK